MRSVTIGARAVGPGHPVFVIAEAGGNHNADLERAKALIDVAADAGADAVKFQTSRAAKLYSRRSGQARYLHSAESIYDIVERREMPYAWIPVLAARAAERGLLFMSTPFDDVSADHLEPHVPAFKIASYDSNNLPLIRHIARKGKPVVLSTGATTVGEIDEAVTAMRAVGNDRIVLLQCVARYPASPDASNLRVIPRLAEVFGVPVGLSDHTEHPLVAPLGAVALGATVIEKHFTLDRTLPGPDHRFAVEPGELAELVRAVRALEAALGDGVKEVMPEEEELHRFAKRHIHAIRDIKRGEALDPHNIAVLRSGQLAPGLPPRFWETVLGKKVARDVAYGDGITWECLLDD